MLPGEKSALEKISTALRKKYPANIEGIFAFGSRVRGDHTEGSDFDVLIVVKERTIDLEEGIIDLVVEEEQKTGFSFDPVIKSSESFHKEKAFHTPFYENFMKEAVPL